ncbi:hypothetical protein INT48_005354, partial [Thamnidium elegans]
TLSWQLLMVIIKNLNDSHVAKRHDLFIETTEKENTWLAENCPADSVALGRAAWTLLHTTAAYYPDRPAPSQMDSMRLFMSTFVDNYPCFKDFKQYMAEEPVRVGSRKKLSEWLCRQHNKVNEKLGKPPFDFEIFERILFHIPMCDIYRMRLVCKTWKAQCEHQLFTLIKLQNQQLHIRIGEKGDLYRTKLSPYQYDFEHQVIEFRKDDDSLGLCYLVPTDRRKFQIIFNAWENEPNFQFPVSQRKYLQEYAQLLYHYRFNAMLEQVYQFPSPFECNEKVQYIADRGMIMSFSYEDTTEQQDNWINPVGIEILSVHVHLSWLLSGLEDARIETQPVYPERYQALTDKLNKEGITDYYPYSQHALKYIMTGEFDLSSFRSDEQTEPTRLEQLRSSLLEAGVNPRVIWKYGFAKAFILKEQPSSIEHNVRAILESENEWVTNKRHILDQYWL